LDDVIVFSKKILDHILHIKHIFEQCKKYGISLNPKKRIFGVCKEILLGHILEMIRINIDLERVKSIMQISFIVNMKAMQYFIGKNNFLRKYISHYA